MAFLIASSSASSHLNLSSETSYADVIAQNIPKRKPGQLRRSILEDRGIQQIPQIQPIQNQPSSSGSSLYPGNNVNALTASYFKQVSYDASERNCVVLATVAAAPKNYLARLINSSGDGKIYRVNLPNGTQTINSTTSELFRGQRQLTMREVGGKKVLAPFILTAALSKAGNTQFHQEQNYIHIMDLFYGNVNAVGNTQLALNSTVAQRKPYLTPSKLKSMLAQGYAIVLGTGAEAAQGFKGNPINAFYHAYAVLRATDTHVTLYSSVEGKEINVTHRQLMDTVSLIAFSKTR